ACPQRLELPPGTVDVDIRQLVAAGAWRLVARVRPGPTGRADLAGDPGHRGLQVPRRMVLIADLPPVPPEVGEGLHSDLLGSFPVAEQGGRAAHETRVLAAEQLLDRLFALLPESPPGSTEKDDVVGTRHPTSMRARRVVRLASRAARHLISLLPVGTQIPPGVEQICPHDQRLHLDATRAASPSCLPVVMLTLTTPPVRQFMN